MNLYIIGHTATWRAPRILDRPRLKRLAFESWLDRLLNRRLSTPDNRRFAKHLSHEQPWIFSFLHCPGFDATNNVAERAIRPAVVARHTWGGNRTRSSITICRAAARSCFPAKKILAWRRWKLTPPAGP